MLILNLPEVERGAVRVRGEIPPDSPLWDDASVTLRTPLAVDVEAHSVGSGILARGTMRTELAGDCRRCLEPVVSRVELPLELYFEPLDGPEREDWEGEIYPLPERGTELELGPAVREQFLLQKPEYALCQKECRGLCPQCGANRNEAECECEPERGESPWGALKDLKFD